MPKEARRHANFPYYTSDIKLQTDYILKNMAKTFKAAGTSLDNVVKAQVFLIDLNHFAEFDEVWRNHFKSVSDAFDTPYPWHQERWLGR